MLSSSFFLFFGVCVGTEDDESINHCNSSVKRSSSSSCLQQQLQISWQKKKLNWQKKASATSVVTNESEQMLRAGKHITTFSSGNPSATNSDAEKGNANEIQCPAVSNSACIGDSPTASQSCCPGYCRQ